MKKYLLLGLLINNAGFAAGINAIEQGKNATATGVSSIAIGTNAKAEELVAVSIGANSEAKGKSSVAHGANAQALGGVDVAVGSRALASGGSGVALGSGAKSTGNYSTALGAGASSSGKGATAIGVQSEAKGNASLAFGRGAIANNESSVALGSGSQTSDVVQTKNATVNGITYEGFAGSEATSSVSVGREGAERVINNVGAGRVSDTSTDAVNGSQLYSVAHQSSDNAKSIQKTNRIVENNTKRISSIENKINDNSKHINDVENKMKRGFASQAALNGLFQPYGVGKFNLTAAVGGYNSDTAIAVGSGYRFNEDTAFKAGIATNTGNFEGVTYNAGINIEW